MGTRRPPPKGDVSPEASPAPEPQLPATVTSFDGQTVTVEDVARIVPLSGDIAEILWTLGLGDKLVGVDVSAVYPPEVMGPLPKIGFERQLSAEGILSLEPTLVIGKEQAGPPEVLDQIRSAGVPVVIVAEPQTLGRVRGRTPGGGLRWGRCDAGSLIDELVRGASSR